MKLHSCILAIVFAIVGFGAGAAWAGSSGLVINASEIGVGKFHRYDNLQHTYPATSVWNPFILPQTASTQTPQVVQNADQSYTIYFSTLDEMLASVVQLSQKTGQKISAFNIHGHGLPGAMWYPKDQAALQDVWCSDWRDAASAADTANYDQYYSPVSKDEIDQIHQIGDNPNVQEPCVSDLAAWQAKTAAIPNIKSYFADDARVHFLSCVVGYGTVGDAFVQGIAGLLLSTDQGRVEASLDFGLGDWSMPSGMGFWDYQSDAQLDHDNSIYPVDRKDSELAQKGTIRSAYLSGAGTTSDLTANQDFVYLDGRHVSGLSVHSVMPELRSFTSSPGRVRIPGTAFYLPVLSK